MSTRRKSKKNPQARAGIWSAIIIAIVMITVVGFRCIELYDKNLTYEQTEEELAQELSDEQTRQEEIAAYEESVGTDEYVEKIARDKLGLVYSDETIFREE